MWAPGPELLQEIETPLRYNPKWGCIRSDKYKHWSKRGFAAPIYASVTSEIDYQIAQLRRRGLHPTLVRLGPYASTVYAWEQWADGVAEAPTRHKGVPLRYRDPSISGVVVQTDVDCP